MTRYEQYVSAYKRELALEQELSTRQAERDKALELYQAGELTEDALRASVRLRDAAWDAFLEAYAEATELWHPSFSTDLIGES